MRALLLVGLLLLATPASSRGTRSMVWQDPTGDDHGPGTYVYPTDALYRPGTFDLREVSLRARGRVVEIRVRFQVSIQDPWNSRAWGGRGFSLQQVHLYLDTDGSNDKGHRETLPGTGAVFGPDRGWEKVVILSPQPTKKLRAWLSETGVSWKGRVVIPRKLHVEGDTLVATVSRRALGARLSRDWAAQAVSLGMDAFADPGTMGIREVNQLPGAHRFGGGTDSRCEPHILDILASSEADQAAALKVRCAWEEGGAVPASLSLISP